MGIEAPQQVDGFAFEKAGMAVQLLVKLRLSAMLQLFLCIVRAKNVLAEEKREKKSGNGSFEKEGSK